MLLLSYAGTVALLLLVLAGFGTLCWRYAGTSYAIAKTGGMVALAAALCFVENFIGLGRPSWLWPFAAAGAGWVLWQNRAEWHAILRGEIYFLLGFAYALACRYMDPDIAANSERLPDAAFIASYLEGSRLPSADLWLPPYKLDFYYSFQHYASALVGRLFGLQLGLTYHLTFSVLVGAVVACAAECLRVWLPSRRLRWLVLLALVVGGTGASPFIHLIKSNPLPWTSVRVVGGSFTTEAATDRLGPKVMEWAGSPSQEEIELPTEPFSFIITLGDHHAPLGGFVLLALAAGCGARLREGFSAAVLGLTLPVCLITNTWVAPLHAVLVVTILVAAWKQKEQVHWRGVAAGVVVGGILIFPFLSRLAMRTHDFTPALRLVSTAQHTPLLPGLFLWWPFLLILALSLAAAKDERRTKIFALFWLVMLLVSECVFMDDIYSGKFERFNTTLKWWSWWISGMLITTGALNLASRQKLCRWGTAVALVLLCTYAFDLGARFASRFSRPHGRLEGTHWMTRKKGWSAVLSYLSEQPRGVVMQRLTDRAFTEEPAIATFSGHAALLGWPEHELLWRGRQADIEVRRVQIGKFYRGELENSLEWLLANNVDYIVLVPGDVATEEIFQSITHSIREAYAWVPLSWGASGHSGVWQRFHKPGGGHASRAKEQGFLTE
jgi:hypothetical protein